MRGDMSWDQLSQQGARRLAKLTLLMLTATGMWSCFCRVRQVPWECLLPALLLTEESKDAEVKKLLEMKDLDLEEMRKRLKKQEKERQSELLQLQMEVRTAPQVLPA